MSDRKTMKVCVFLKVEEYDKFTTMDKSEMTAAMLQYELELREKGLWADSVSIHSFTEEDAKYPFEVEAFWFRDEEEQLLTNNSFSDEVGKKIRSKLTDDNFRVIVLEVGYTAQWSCTDYFKYVATAMGMRL